MAIKKFKGRDFHTWQVKLQLLLIEKDLWDVIDGRTTTKSSNVDGMTKSTTKDRRAIAMISLRLSNAYLHHIDFSKIVKEVWGALNALFG